MALASDRLARRVRRDFGSPRAVEPLIAELESERVQAAVVLWAKGDVHRLRDAVALAHRDWRDALVRAGLAGDDWRDRLDAELGTEVSMRIRPFVAADLPALVDLTIETFRPFYEGYVRPLLGEDVFRHQHGRWEQDYRDEVPGLHDPAAGRHVAIAEVGATIAGYVAWRPGERPRSGEISMLAVSSGQRRQHAGRALCLHAIAEMKAGGVEVVGIGTGDDAFHSGARALYESLGFTKIPIAGYLKEI